MKIEPVALEGRFARLEPLLASHHAALCEVGLDPDLWEWVPYRVLTVDEMRAYIDDALKAQAAGSALPFATIERATGRVVGSTRYMNIDRSNRRVEIGATWIAMAAHRDQYGSQISNAAPCL
jgi:RimJ/RimL family protein N-acetyltransferase